MVHLNENAVPGHYGSENLRSPIFEAIFKPGLDLNNLHPVDLAPVEEFHMGRRAATVEIVARAGPSADDRVLDIGSGLGGLVRYLTSKIDCRTTGLDLTPDYVPLAQEFARLPVPFPR